MQRHYLHTLNTTKYRLKSYSYLFFTLETGSVRQTVLDTATLEVSYRMEWLRRPDSKEPMQDLLLLQAGGKVTKFFSYKTLQRDSLLRITPTEQVLANVGNFKGLYL